MATCVRTPAPRRWINPSSRPRASVRRTRIAVAALVGAGIALSAGCSNTISPPEPPIAAPEGKTWALMFDGKFDGTSLDTTKFTPCFDWNAGDCTSSFNEGKEHYLPSQVQVADGKAHLAAEPLDPPYHDDECYQGVCTYKAGMISTARPDQSSPYLYKFTYGYVEARLKLPNTPGISTGFWMLPTRDDFKYDYEIDILENLGGKPDVIYQTYQYNNRQDAYKVNDITHDTNGKCPKIDFTTDFHTYGMDWQPDHIAFYIDGQECGHFSPALSDLITNESMQIILSMGVDTEWPRAANLVLPSQTATDHLDIDYVRVWQAK